jgi:hypothetical protein
VRVTVGLEGTPRGIELQMPFANVPLQRVSNGVYARDVAVIDLLAGYRTGDLHNAVAMIDVATLPTTSQQTLVVVNVKDGSVSNVSPQTLVPGLMQAASHVVNIRSDSLFAGPGIPPQIISTFYQHFDDDYDFIAVIKQVQQPAPIGYFAIRNQITGLGLQQLDRSGNYGNVQQLQGTVFFPNEGFYDPAETSMLHELAHRWMNFGDIPSVRIASPHWPISTLAHGITGSINLQTGELIPFRYHLTRQPNSTYSITVEPTRPLQFNDFELYLMGLLPADSVGQHIVFLNQQQYHQLGAGGVLIGATDTITVAKWIAREGVRSPGYVTAQRRFRMATIVLSRGRLLDQEEMSFFNHLAMRGESRTLEPIFTQVGAVRTITLPFFGATGGRAELFTTLGSSVGAQ